MFGGLLPLIGYGVAPLPGIFSRVVCPMIVAALTFVMGSLLLKETHGTKIWDEMKA